MDAIEYLTDQHREVESLFDQIESAIRMKPKLRLWRKLADLLSVHRALEETIFFAAARKAGLEAPLLDTHEDLSSDPLIAELVEMDEVTGEMLAKLWVLKERKRRHARRLEEELFPRARQLLTPCQLQVLGRLMEHMAEHLMSVGASERLIARIAQA